MKLFFTILYILFVSNSKGNGRAEMLTDISRIPLHSVSTNYYTAKKTVYVTHDNETECNGISLTLVIYPLSSKFSHIYW